MAESALSDDEKLADELQNKGFEERRVTLQNLKDGVTAKGGHELVLLVGAEPEPEPEPDPDPTGGGTGSGQPAGDATGGDDPERAGTGGEDPAGADTGAEDHAGSGTGAGTTAEKPGPDATPSLKGAFDAAHFDTDKGFPLKEAIPTFRAIAALAKREPSRTLVVVGHTDAVGGAEHNLGLSQDRADCIAAYLKNDVDAWLNFYGTAPNSKPWGAAEDRSMLKALPFGGDPYLKDGGNATAAMKAFQKKKRLPDSGRADTATRRALVREYMQAEGTTVPSGTRIDTLACGKRHLEVSTQSANAANRRVDVFAFESGDVKPAPSECKNGQHPGCTVYDAWKRAVQGPVEVA